MNRHQERAGFRETTCGCLYIGAVQFCKVHSNAPKMLDLLKRLSIGIACCSFVDEARAILRDLEGESNV